MATTATSKICLVLELDEEPNDKDKEIIKLLLGSLLLSIQPSAKVIINTKFGSWIVIASSILQGAAQWLIPEFGSWLSGKGFDWIQSHANQPKRLLMGDRVPQTEVESSAVKPTSIEVSNGIQANDESKIFVKLADQMSTILENPVFCNSKKVTFRMAEWSASRNIGISISLTKTKDTTGEQELDFSVDLTDSVEDFNSRLNF
jgi:hypothetical protein